MTTLESITNDTSRTPHERDLARILILATSLLEKGDITRAQNILDIYLDGIKLAK